MPVTIIYPFVSANRSTGAPINWVPTGAEPRLTLIDALLMTGANGAGITQDTNSLDGTSWKDSGGTVINWSGKRITNIQLNMALSSSSASPNLDVNAATLALTGGFNIFTGIIGLTAAITDKLIISQAVVAPPAIVTWADRLRDLILAGDFLLSLIAVPGPTTTVRCDQMYLTITWDLIAKGNAVWEY